MNDNNDNLLIFSFKYNFNFYNFMNEDLKRFFEPWELKILEIIENKNKNVKKKEEKDNKQINK